MVRAGEPDAPFGQTESRRGICGLVKPTRVGSAVGQRDGFGDVASRQFCDVGSQYRPAGLVIFTQGVSTGCGQASAAVGPFYCPPDEKAYIDIDFFEQLQNEFGAGGDFAQLYVLAHEYGHHMQTVLGTSEQIRAAQQRQPGSANELSVRLELQADCYAGLWARAAGQQEDIVLEEGDIEEGLAAAAAVGDDRIQSSAGAEVNPETWTHGSAEQRQHWFVRGIEGGNANSCNTFEGRV